MKTIFISVAAYNEPHIRLMLDNCLENAEFPDRIHFGLWLHNNDDNETDVSDYKNVKVAQVNYKTLLGTLPTRLNAISLYDGEDYYFQVDAHLLFEKHWDTKIIDKFEKIQEVFEKPIITTFTPWWSIKDGVIKNYSNDSLAQCEPMCLDLEATLIEGYPKPKTEYSAWNPGEIYKEHYLVGGAVLFTLPSFIEEVLPDPLIMFNGEESTIALRAWTRGYRMVCIQNPIAWHLNKFDGDRYEKDRYWDRRNVGEAYEHWARKNMKGNERAKKILTGELLGYWGAETKELLKSYEEASGIDFSSIYQQIEARRV